ncbi:MAG: class I SAM-dependent methyltransferase [Desulfurococcales archaeon]|nr:class I SAM-dependent methyltransferase [Desulfurococcales archaeon]
MFVDKAHLFLLVLKHMYESGVKDAENLDRLLEKHGIRRGAEILELGCGIGRVAIPLAKKGYKVTCLDISDMYINEAQSRARGEGVEEVLDAIVADAWRIDEIFPENRFDAVYMIWTTLIGYHKEKEKDLELLKKIQRITKPNGLLAILRTVNRDLVLARRICERGNIPVISEWEDILVIERPEFDGVNSLLRNKWEYYKRENRDLKFLGEHEFTLRIYSINELIDLAVEAGWRLEAAYHDLVEFKEYIPGRSGINIVLRKPA